jgi:hypothetical protein
VSTHRKLRAVAYSGPTMSLGQGSSRSTLPLSLRTEGLHSSQPPRQGSRNLLTNDGLKGKGVLECSQEFNDTVGGYGSEDDADTGGDGNDAPALPRPYSPAATNQHVVKDTQWIGSDSTDVPHDLYNEEDDDFQTLPPKKGSSFVRKATGHAVAPRFDSGISSDALVVPASRFEPRVTRLSQQSGGTDGRVRPGTVATSKQPFKKPATEKKLPLLPKSTGGAYKRLRKL